MLRTVVICASLVALAAPSAGLAMHDSSGDGSLVVKHGSSLTGTPVVALTITGAVWGHVDYGRIVIDDSTPNDAFAPEVTGAGKGRNVPNSDTASAWSGADFKFRAVGGRYTILIYGSNIDVVAFGSGRVSLAGVPVTPSGDGSYSLNGDPFRSLPGVPSKPLAIGTALPTG